MKTEWFFYRKVRWKTTFRFKCLLLLSVIFSGWITYESVFTKLHLFLSPGMELNRADALIVEGWVFDSGKRLALELYRKGYGKYLFTAGGPIPRNASCLGYETWAEASKDYFLRAGVDERYVVAVGSDARGTREMALALKPVLQKYQARSVIVVTQKGHELRSYLVFKKILANLNAQVMVSAAEEEWFQASNWWKTHDGLVFLFTEYLSLFYYWLNDYI